MGCLQHVKLTTGKPLRLKGLRQGGQVASRLFHTQDKVGSIPTPATNNYAMVYLVIIGILSLAGALLILRYEQQQNTKEINKLKEILCMKK